MIDLDGNATTRLLPEVLEAMLPWLSGNHANASGSYRMAKAARGAIENARAEVARLIGAEVEEMIFTGGGTESVNAALHSCDVLAGNGHALVTATEHSAVLRFVESREREVQLLPVNAGGRVDLGTFSECLEGAGYVSVMAANNETGVLQDLGELVKLAHQKGIPMHTDAIQLVGKVPINVRAVGIDLLSLSAHKFHGPKGVGALYLRSGLEFSPSQYGGGQEKGRRSGTENVAGIVGMGEAARLARLALENGQAEDVCEMRDAFENFLLNEVTGCVRNGDVGNRLPNTSHISFEGCDSGGMLILLDQVGIACSAGSACMTGKQKPSHVQIAMGIPEARARTSLRFSFTRLNGMGEALEAAGLVKKCVEKLRRVQGHGVGPVAIYT